jgi:hypothetical protein
MKNAVQSACSVILIALVLAFCGCGKSADTWPSRVEDDWGKNVKGKGMANVWGVVFDVAEIGDAQISIKPEATLGATCSESSGKNVISFGDKVFELETTGTESLKLSINGMHYGSVRGKNRVVMDVGGNVYVDQELRKPAK